MLSSVAKFSGSILIATCVTSVCFAQSEAPTMTARTGVQLRIDSLGEHTTVGNGPTVSKQNIQVSTARLGVAGEIGSNISYTLRLNLRSASGYESERAGPDGTMPALDRAYIEHRLLPALSFRFGRMPLVAGSIETDYSGFDVYSYSYVNESFGKVSPLTTAADLTYRFEGQSITLAAANGFYDGPAEIRGVQTGENLSFGLSYRGRLANGLLRPIASINQFNRIRNGAGASRDDKVNYSGYAVGTQVFVGDATLDLEYNSLHRPEFSSFDADAKETKNLERTVSGFITQIAYEISAYNLRPFAKLSLSNEETAGKETMTANRASAGIEFKPTAKGFRYHAVVTDHNDEASKYDASGAKTSTESHRRQYILGLLARI